MRSMPARESSSNECPTAWPAWRRPAATMAVAAAIILILACLASGTPETDVASPPADPVDRTIAGWTVRLDPQLLLPVNRDAGERAIEALENHLQRVAYVVPEDRLEKLRAIPIRLDLHHPKLAAMQYHPSREWLEQNGFDPRLAKHVHLPRAADLLERHTWAKHPYVVLHELAHAYHDQVLGFDHARVEAAYRSARERGIYESVLLYTGERVRHYALTDAKEYFAELTEAYLGVNDFYPFVRAELKEHDPEMHRLLEDIWGPLR